MNAFFKSQFSYCTLSWMFHIRILNNKISRFQERRLCMIYNDNTSSFIDLLEKDNSVSVHHRNIQVLAAELLMTNGLSPKLISDCWSVSVQSKKQVHFLFSDSSHSLRWHRITLPLGTENLGTSAK